MGELFAVISGKGGTGKTSVCAGIATALAEAGKNVLCVDCDVGLRNLDISLGMSDNGNLSFLDVAEFGYDLKNAPRHSLYPTLAFLTAPMNRRPQDIDPDSFVALLRKARDEFDYIFLDAPAGVDAGFRLVCSAADQFLLVTGSDPAAVRDAAQVGAILELAGKKNVRLVVNRVNRAMLSTVRMTIDDVMDTAGLPLAGIVMEDHHVILAASFCLPLLKYSSRCEAARAYRRIAARIQGFHQPISLR